MSLLAITKVKHIKCNTPSTKLVLFILANYANEDFECFPSEKHLGLICGISDRQVRRCITWLQDHNYIRVKRRKGLSNIYTLTVDTHVLRLRTQASANTKDIQKKAAKKLKLIRSKNELAG